MTFSNPESFDDLPLRGRQTDETPPEASPRRKVGRQKGSKTRPVAERTLRPRLPKPTDPAITQQEAVNNLEGMFMSRESFRFCSYVLPVLHQASGEGGLTGLQAPTLYARGPDDSLQVLSKAK
ncbi:hypothetical protein E4U61_007354 [Claviceps capensis]|nr:hypothetical protein E4U61_007354 [Claviceps capensis]